MITTTLYTVFPCTNPLIQYYTQPTLNIFYITTYNNILWEFIVLMQTFYKVQLPVNGDAHPKSSHNTYMVVIFYRYTTQ